MIPISKLLIGKEEKKAVLEVLDSGMLAQGPRVKELEKKFVELTGAKYALGISNGTAALHVALYALGIQPGDEVITTPFTFIATANSILMAGAKPIFVDIDEKTYNIDPEKIEAAITKKTKAIIAVNLYGQPADFAKINKIAKKHKLMVVEDAAQSVGASYHGKVSGNLSDAGSFSLYATKNITSGEGGVLTFNSKKIYEKSKLFRHHGQSEKKRYSYEGLGYNYRMTDVQAAIGTVQMDRLEFITKRRQKIAEIYNKAFAEIPGLITPYILDKTTHVYHQYTLRLTPEYKVSRDKFRKILLDKGIETNIYYPYPLYEFSHLVAKPKRKDFPVTEKIIREVVSIPVHPVLTDKEIKYIVETIQSI